jgi:RNA polymerase-binding transcription factor DksA
MNRTIENRFKHRLLTIREKLGGEMTRISDTILSGTCPFGEHDGCVSESIDKELALEHAEEGICQAVDDALARLAQGGFGRCICCGKGITLRRLEALPYTAYCIHCEYERERGQAQASERLATSDSC